MAITKDSSRQCLEVATVTVTQAQLAAEGTLTSGVTVEIADLPPGAIPMIPVINETFDGGTNTINIGLDSDLDALYISGGTAGVAVGAVQAAETAVKLSVTGTITTGSIQIALPYLINGRAESNYG